MTNEVKPCVLVIDDDSEIRYSLQRVLSSRDYRVLTASSGEEGITVASDAQPHVIFLDNRMVGMTGIETLQHLRSASPRSMTILMTAFGTTQTAIEAMKYGAFDYIIKPFDIKRVFELTERATQSHKDLLSAKEQSTRVLDSEDYKEGIVGSSEPMQEVFKIIGQVAASDVTVMITGESGTGKELVARCIFQHSHRAEKPFIAVNCAAIPDNLIESELFGHEKGSFTGATQQRTGKFELCDGGTLFLDEIGDMALPTQTKILRALQEGEIQRVGGNETVKVDVRLIAATNKNLEKMVEEGQFREDLYYRLNVMRIRMPSLRDRREDIHALVDFMLQKLSKARKTRVTNVSPEALACLKRYSWPGNVRELENVIQRSAVVAQGETVLVRDLPREIVAANAQPESAPQVEHASDRSDRSDGSDKSDRSDKSEKVELIGQPKLPKESADSADAAERPTPKAVGPADGEKAAPASKPANGAVVHDLNSAYDALYRALRAEVDESILQEIERAMIERVLAETGGNQVKASKLLGITRATLRKRIDQHSLKY